MVNGGIRPEWRRMVERAQAEGDGNYAEFVARQSAESYRQRVSDIGFTGLGRVLDLGCGHGLWSTALARVNREVVAVEIHRSRLLGTQALAADEGLENIRCVRANAIRLPFPDASFDGIFCYGVFMFLPPQVALDEMKRVLRDGGRLYACTNGPGWWLGLVLRNAFGNPHVRRSAWRALGNGMSGGVPSSVSLRDVPRLLGPESWQIEAVAPEGQLGRDDATLATYPARRFGLSNVIEFVALRRVRPAPILPIADRSVDPELLALYEDTAGRTHYEYVTPLDRFPQPRPVTDLVGNCDRARLDWSIRLGCSQSPGAFLSEFVRRCAPAGLTAEERVVRLVTFAQKHFFHHFAGQPVLPSGDLLLNPVAVFAFQACRCGSSARFLVDAFIHAGFEARLLGAACHTAAEVLLDGRWVLVDASLYPPGVFPRDTQGRLIDVETALGQPTLLDAAPSYINYHHEYIEAVLTRYPELEAPIGKYLDAPLLPSTAYLGEEFFAGRVAGQVTRYRKRGTPEEWEADANYGWGALDIDTTTSGVPRATEQRPRQPVNLHVEGDMLAWDPAAVPPGAGSVSWVVHASAQSRAWRYADLPVGCGFEVPGRTLAVAEPGLALRELDAHERFVTVRAIVPEWRGRDVFFLPSTEYDLSSAGLPKGSDR